MRAVLIRAGIVLTVLWTVVCLGGLYLTEAVPSANTFRQAWSEPEAEPYSLADYRDATLLLRDIIQTNGETDQLARKIAEGIEACHGATLPPLRDMKPWERYYFEAPDSSNPFAGARPKPELPPGFVVDNPECEAAMEDREIVAQLERRQADLQGFLGAVYDGARNQVIEWALLTGALWLVPVALVWAVVWIFLPLGKRQ